MLPSGFEQDYQKTYFDLPSWIEDLQEHQEFNQSYLSENYQVIKLLKQGNGGNVYLAQNKSNDKEVVIKESKPHILCFGKIKRQELRKNEWIVSGEAKQMSPRRIEKVREWINNYYIYEYIDGINLSEFCDQHSLFSYRNKSLLENYEKFKKLMKCFGSLLETVAASSFLTAVASCLLVSAACAAPPKNIKAEAIRTDAVPALNFLIPY